jgi:hypothetical protein
VVVSEAVEAVALVAEEAADSNEEDLTTDQEKCTRQLAQSVRKNVKFRLSQQRASQFSAKSVILKRKTLKAETKVLHREDLTDHHKLQLKKQLVAVKMILNHLNQTASKFI